MPPRRPQDALKTPPERPQDAPKAFHNAPRRPKTALRRLQDAPKTPQDSPKILQDAPKTPQGAPKTREFSIFWNHGAPNSKSLASHPFYCLHRAIVFVMIYCTTGSVDFIHPLSVVPFPKMRAAALAEGLYNSATSRLPADFHG